MASVSSAGVGSGLELETLIQDLVNAEAAPKTAELNRREATLTTQISAYGTLKSAASDFKQTLFNLSLQSTYQQRSAASGDRSIFTATADETATPGSYNIEVTALAAANKVSTKDFAAADTTVGTGQLTVAVGSNSFNVTIDGTNSTVSGIRAAIEQADTSDLVSTTLVTVDSGTQIVITSNETGLSNTVDITVTGDGDGNDADNAGLSQLITANLNQLTPAADATIEIDGQQVTNSSNVFENAITGVTITASAQSTATETDTLIVAFDTSAITGQITDMVDAYNEFIGTVNQMTSYDAETQVAGVLLGDSLTRGLMSQIRGVFGDTIPGLTGSVTTFADLGMETQLDGSITYEVEQINSLLSTNLEGIQELFAGDDGIATRLDSIVGAYTETNGILDDKNENLDSGLDDIEDEREALELRLVKLEERLRAQFVNLDLLVSNLRSQGDFLSQQLSSLPGFAKSSDS